MIGKLTEEEFMAKVLAFHGHAAPGVMLGGFLVGRPGRTPGRVSL